MNKIRDLVLVSALVLAIGFLSYQAGIIGEPGIGVEDRGEWDSVDSSEIKVESSVWVDNQNPVSVNLRNIRLDYSLLMNDVRLAHGTKDGLNIRQGNQTIDFHTSIIQGNIQEWWVKHVRNEELSRFKMPLHLSSDIGPSKFTLNGLTYTDKVETNIEGSIDSSVSQMKGIYKGPKLLPGNSSLARQSRPEIEIVNAEANFGKINMNKTQILFQIDLRNRNQYPIPAPQLTGDLKMNDVEIAEWDANSYDKSNAVDDILFEPGETENLSFKTDIDNKKIEDWLTSHIRREEYSEAEVEIKFKFESETASFTVPQNEGITCSFDLQTAILEDDQKTMSKFNSCQNPLNS